MSQATLTRIFPLYGPGILLLSLLDVEALNRRALTGALFLSQHTKEKTYFTPSYMARGISTSKGAMAYMIPCQHIDTS